MKADDALDLMHRAGMTLQTLTSKMTHHPLACGCMQCSFTEDEWTDLLELADELYKAGKWGEIDGGDDGD